MLADYGDVVSRREYEALQASNNVCDNFTEIFITQAHVAGH